MKKRSRVIIWTVGIAILLTTVVFLFFRLDASYFHVLHNYDASCHNCRSFIRFHFSAYAERHNGWYPRGGTNALDSLSKAVTQELDVHHYTSHSRRKNLVNHWKEHKSFPEDLICYRYNEGLREDDPSDLIIMYYYEPTVWECQDDKMKEIGRPVMRIHGSWEFLPEAEFQKEEARTLDYLKKNGRLKISK